MESEMDREPSEARIVEIRDLATRICEWDQDWGQLSAHEQQGFCEAVAVEATREWNPIPIAQAHWLASHFQDIASVSRGVPTPAMIEAPQRGSIKRHHRSTVATVPKNKGSTSGVVRPA